MKTIGIILTTLGIISGLLGIRSYWRDYTYKKVSIAVKPSAKSVVIEPVRNGLSNIIYSILFDRDGAVDTTEHKITEEYTYKNPLPTIEQLQAASLYVHYVPKDKRSETAFPYRVVVTSDGIYPGFYNRALLGQMFTFILIGYMVRMFGQKQHPSVRGIYD